MARLKIKLQTLFVLVIIVLFSSLCVEFQGNYLLTTFVTFTSDTSNHGQTIIFGECEIELLFDTLSIRNGGYYHQFACLTTALWLNGIENDFKCLQTNNITLIVTKTCMPPECHILPFIQQMFDIKYMSSNNIKNKTELSYYARNYCSFITPLNKPRHEQYRKFFDYFKHYLSFNQSYKMHKDKQQKQIVVINRIKERAFSNINELYKVLRVTFGDLYDIKVVYFENMDLFEQIEMINNIPSGSYVISTHGANLVNLVFLKESIKVSVVEICPPYLHCKEHCQKGILCPDYYYKRFPNLNYYGLAQEFKHWNCSQHCHKYGKDATKKHVNFSVPLNVLNTMIDVINKPYDKRYDIKKHTFIMIRNESIQHNKWLKRA